MSKMAKVNGLRELRSATHWKPVRRRGENLAGSMQQVRAVVKVRISKFFLSKVLKASTVRKRLLTREVQNHDREGVGRDEV